MHRRVGFALAATAVAAKADFTYNFASDLPYTALDFFTVPFFVPVGISEIQIDHARTDSTTTNILDWGLSNTQEVVGWGGGLTDSAIIGVNATSRGYRLAASSISGAALLSGNWSVLVGKPRIETPPGSYSINITLRTAPTLPAQTERTPYVQSPPLDIPPCAAIHSAQPEAQPQAQAGDAEVACLAWYAGDFHVHSRESGDAYANATADEVAAFAASQGLDFVHFSDHNTPSLASFLVDAQSRHASGASRVLLLPGVEFTTYYGHAGALFTTEFVDFRMNWPRASSAPAVSITSSVQAIHAQGGLFSINHLDIYIPSSDPDGDEINSCVGCYWDFDGALPSSLVDAMEIGIQSYAGSIPEGQVASPLAIQHWDHMHALGYTQIAPISGSDDHHGGQNDGLSARRPWARPRAVPTAGVPLPTVLANGHRLASAIGSPATMVLAANLSHAAVREGVSLGRTVVKMWHATDWMLDLTACYSSSGSGKGRRLRSAASAACASESVRIGSSLAVPSSTSAQVQLTATVTLPGLPSGGQPSGQYFVTLVRNNEQWYRANITTAPFSYNVTVPVPVAGTDRWRAEVHESVTGLLHTLTNHIFLPSPQQ